MRISSPKNKYFSLLKYFTFSVALLFMGCPSSNDPGTTSAERKGPKGDAESFYGIYSHVGFRSGRATVLGTVVREAEGDRLVYKSSSGREFEIDKILTGPDGNAIAKVLEAASDPVVFNTNLEGTPDGKANLDRIPVLSLGNIEMNVQYPSFGSQGGIPLPGGNPAAGQASLLTEMRVFRLETQPGFYELKYLEAAGPQSCPLYTRRASETGIAELVAVQGAARCPSMISVSKMPAGPSEFAHLCGLAYQSATEHPVLSPQPCVYEESDFTD